MRKPPFFVKEMFTEREGNEYEHNNKKNAASNDSSSFWSKMIKIYTIRYSLNINVTTFTIPVCFSCSSQRRKGGLLQTYP